MTRNIDRGGLNGALTDHVLEHSPKGILPPKPSPVARSSPQKWNSKDLPWRITSDVTAAACASGLVAPLITIIDRAIIENASNRSNLRASLLSSTHALFTRPHSFLTSKPALLITALYFGTYATANAVDTVSNTVSNKPANATTSGPAKFLATSSVNMSLCLYKDSQFARMFGPPPGIAGTVTRAVPTASYALFAFRDSLTIFASFNLPPLIAPILPLSQEVEKEISRASVAQFLAPAGIQFLSTPLHLLGLDLYNRPMGNGTPWQSRMGRVTRDWLGSSFARMARIVPAFGVGGVVNAGVRQRMMENVR